MASLGQTNEVNFLQGDISLETVTQLLTEGRACILAANAECLFDLSKVDQFTSAGVALLVDWVRYAKEQGKAIRFSNLPASFYGIIEVCGLESFFGESVSLS